MEFKNKNKLNTGIFCLSLDMELMWGRHDINYQDFTKRVEKERVVIKKILDILDKYEIPTTWAFVGHLFLNNCRAVKGIKHPEILRGKFPWYEKDWFYLDPCTDNKKNPEWYAIDILKSVQKIKNQDIGCHSFSHVQFGNEGCSRECAESEVKASVEAAGKQKIYLNSFVFPYNSVGHIDVLRKYGFKSFRGEDQYTNLSRINRLKQMVELYLPIAGPLHKPSIVKGLVNIPGSFYFLSARGSRKYIGANVRFRKAKMGIDAAISRKAVFHMWTHPIDLVDNMPTLMKDFEKIIKYVAEQRNENKIEIQNMKQIADRYL